jgi:taurine transport system permease protein
MGPAAGLAKRWASVTLLVVAWEAVGVFGLADPFLLPRLSDVVAKLGSELMRGDLAQLVLITSYRTFLAFGLAAVVGVAIGIAMSMSPGARWFFDPVVSFAFPIPKIALMPIFILWFGFFDASKVLMTAFSAVFTIISATHLGTRHIDKYLVWSARALGTPDRRLFWKIYIPAALPPILTGLQIALPTCLIVSLVTEMLSGGRGLGGYMIAAARFAESEKVFAGIVCTALVGSVLIEGFAWARRRLLAWHSETITATA